MAYTAGSSKDAGNLIANRRTHSRIGEGLAELYPSEKPFLTFLTKMSKLPTSDPEPIKFYHVSGWADRRFYAGGAGTWSSGSVDNVAVELTKGGSDDVGYLVENLVVRIKHIGGGDDDIAIIDTVDSQQQIDLTGISGTLTNIADGDMIQVIGTAFARGSDKASPTYDTVSTEQTYTQIFKTLVDVTNTLRATESFAVQDEYKRLLQDKMKEHAVDVERALLFGEVGAASGATTVNSNSVYSFAGIVTWIETNSSSSTIHTPSLASYTYDDFIDDMEEYYTQAGDKGTDEKLCLAGSSVIGFFSKVGSNKMWADFTVNVEHGSMFGIDVTRVNHPFGTLNLVHEPLFRGSYASNEEFYRRYMVCVDLQNAFYRPLQGNGVDRDTFVEYDLPSTEDKVMDQIVTEAAGHWVLPQSHALFKFSA